MREGDVVVGPAPDGNEVVHVTLRQRFDSAAVELAAADVSSFLGRTYASVPKALSPDTWTWMPPKGTSSLSSAAAQNTVRSPRRDVMPSLAKILLRCHSTVRVLMNNCPPISALVYPSRASFVI